MFAALAALVALACEPQVVDAVVLEPDAGAGSGAGAASTCAAPSRDTDQDSVPDCEDACPRNPEKIEPGRCGCELPDEDRPEIASCVTQVDSLVHRYTFGGSGQTVRDSRGASDGVLLGSGAPLDGSGAVTLSRNEGEAYVDLPNGLLSSLDSVTLEVWFTFFGGRGWERIFDFGDNNAGIEGQPGQSGLTYLFLTPLLPDEERPFVRVAYKCEGIQEGQLDATRGVPVGALTHLAVTFDRETTALSLYFDGELEAEKLDDGIDLSKIRDVNNWLGRSNFIADWSLSATIDEFRMYSRALTPNEIRTSFRAGPNPSFLSE